MCRYPGRLYAAGTGDGINDGISSGLRLNCHTEP